MIFLSSLAGLRPSKRRFTLQAISLLAIVLATAACASGIVATTPAPVEEQPTAMPTADAAGEQLPDAGDGSDVDATESDAADASTVNDSESSSSLDVDGDDNSDESDDEDSVVLDLEELAEQFGMEPDDLLAQFGGNLEELAAEFGVDVEDLTEDLESDEFDSDEGDEDDASEEDEESELDGDSDFFASFFDAFVNSAWDQVLEAALVPSECATPVEIEYPAGYYAGSLIDSHFHMPPLNDDFGGEGTYGGTGGVDSDLYASIDPNDRPLLGTTTTLDEVACTLRQEGSEKAFTFFPVYDDAPDALIDLAYNAMERHGDLFVPFIQSTSSEISTVEASVLEEFLDKRPDLFRGFGEIGDSPTEPWNPPPDHEIYIGGFEVARDNDLLVMFHPGEGHHENLDRALKMFPDVKFMVHGDFVRPYIGELMADNPNVYYTFNDIFDEVIPMFRFGDKQDFIDAMEQNWDQMLDQALMMYEDLINEYPDQFMWGTDRADIVWNYDPDIGQLLSEFGRDFIGRLDPAVQEKVAYLNAEALLQ